MPEMIAGFPYWRVQFDESGALAPASAGDAVVAEAPKLATNLFVFSHGWNNDVPTAERLYQRFFNQIRQVLDSRPPIKSSLGVVAVFWPAIRWADENDAFSGGAAGLAAPPLTDQQLVLNLKSIFTTPAQTNAIDALADLLSAKAPTEAALRQFHAEMCKLVNPAVPAIEDNGEHAGLIEADAVDVFQRFAALAPQRRPSGAAGLGDIFGPLWNGAKEALRAMTYWQMKSRAGTIGQTGLSSLINRLTKADPGLRLHLLGHSFGARLVSFALTGLAAAGPSPVASLFLLQGAFSHFAFAEHLPQDWNRAGALAGMQNRVCGPLCVSHSLKDLAVGTAYPLASIASRDDASAISDVFYRWGAMGHDGAQAVDAAASSFLPVGSTYSFVANKFLNFDGNAVITRGGPPSGAHSDIFYPTIAWAVLAAAGVA